MNQHVDAPAVEVRPGQIWADNDPRSTGRHIRIVRIEGAHAVVVRVTGRPPVAAGRATRIRLDRFRPTSTGYRLVSG